MAYPFVKAPTFAEFKHRLINEFGCEYKTLDAMLTDNKGHMPEVRYFEREISKEDVRRVAVDFPDEQECVIYGSGAV